MDLFTIFCFFGSATERLAGLDPTGVTAYSCICKRSHSSSINDEWPVLWTKSPREFEGPNAGRGPAASYAALVGERARGVALADGGAAAQQGEGLGRPAEVAELAEKRLERTVGRAGQVVPIPAGAAVGLADEVVARGGEGAERIRSGGPCDIVGDDGAAHQEVVADGKGQTAGIDNRANLTKYLRMTEKGGTIITRHGKPAGGLIGFVAVTTNPVRSLIDLE
jgi:hypothetical protein